MPKLRMSNRLCSYEVMENGDIVRLDMKDFKPSGQWKMQGLERITSNFGTTQFIPFRDLTPERITKIQKDLRFKNGQPKYTVRDVDHGTTRVWGEGLRTLSIA